MRREASVAEFNTTFRSPSFATSFAAAVSFGVCKVVHGSVQDQGVSSNFLCGSFLGCPANEDHTVSESTLVHLFLSETPSGNMQCVGLDCLTAQWRCALAPSEQKCAFAFCFL